MKKIAVVCADGLGDGLLSLVFAHNLAPQYQITTFSNYLTQLHLLFPDKKIEPFPIKEEAEKILSSFDQVISTDGAFLASANFQHNLGEKYRIYPECEFDGSKTVLQNFLDICRRDYGIQKVTTDNGIVVPAHLIYRKHSKRVIIHPLSTHHSKNWPAKKYIKLATLLTKKGYEPQFIMSPAEQLIWKTFLPKNFSMPTFENLQALADFIYESGYMIGNDSGIGHLAANLGLPTLSLFARFSVAQKWRPNWNQGVVITPTWQLPGARLRTQYWKLFLTVRKVVINFEKLSKVHERL